MNLVYVCADRGIPVAGHKGASAHVRAITAALAGLGHRVQLACARRGAGNPLPAGVTVHDLPREPPAAAAALRALVAGADLVIERYSLDSGPARAVTAAAGVPLLLEVNAPLVLEAYRYRGLTDLPRWLAWEAATLGAADAVVAVSAALVDYVTDVAPGVAVRCVPNGADLARFAGAAPAVWPAAAGGGHGPVVGFVGSMKPWHGAVELVRAFAELPAVAAGGPAAPRLLIVGDGPQLPAVQAAVGAAGLSGVHCTGAVPQDAVPGWLALMDLATAPYTAATDYYFSPLKIVEYLAAGVPVVASDLGDAAALIGSAGRVVPASDPDALHAALHALVTDDAARAAAAAAAPGRVAQRDWSSTAVAVLAAAGTGAPARA